MKFLNQLLLGGLLFTVMPLQAMQEKTYDFFFDFSDDNEKILRTRADTKAKEVTDSIDQSLVNKNNFVPDAKSKIAEYERQCEQGSKTLLTAASLEGKELEDARIGKINEVFAKSQDKYFDNYRTFYFYIITILKHLQTKMKEASPSTTEATRLKDLHKTLSADPLAPLAIYMSETGKKLKNLFIAQDEPQTVNAQNKTNPTRKASKKLTGKMLD